MTTITGTVLDTGGAPVPGVEVVAHLMAAPPWPAGVRVSPDAGTVSGSDGGWQLTLTPTSTYPPGAYYLVDEGNAQWAIVVPDTGSHPIGDVVVAAAPITAAVEAARIAEPSWETGGGSGFVDATVGEWAVAWDGVTDDTANLVRLAAAAVLLGSPLRLPPGVGMVSTWAPPSGLVVVGAGREQTTIRQLPSASGANASVVDASNTTGVTVSDLTVDGNLAAFGAVSTEHKHGVQAQGVADLTLRNVRVVNCKGDGVYIGRSGSVHSARVVMSHCAVTGAYRNGLSVIDLTDGKFDFCDFTASVGTAPQAGVDVEPNSNADTVSDLRFVACTMSGNAGYGFTATMYPGGLLQERVALVGCAINDNTLQGVYLVGTTGIEFVGCEIDSNAQDGVYFVGGTILDTVFVGGRIARNGQYGIRCQIATGSTVKNTKLLGVTILDNGGNTPGTFYGMIWGLDSGGGSIDGLFISGVTCGNRLSTNQKYGVYHSVAVVNLTEKNNDFRGNVTSGAIYNDDCTTRLRSDNIGTTRVTGVASSQTVPGSVHWYSCFAIAPITVTLPLTPEPDIDYTFMDTSVAGAAANPVTIVPNTGQSIAGGASNVLLNTTGGTVRLAFQSPKWYIL